ncbi:MAG: hypothetical protein HXY22_04975 [Alphaproteobacteria bacterium]|nr:hypothetical protein [Alphaproteobacteria bacterium]
MSLFLKSIARALGWSAAASVLGICALLVSAYVASRQVDEAILAVEEAKESVATLEDLRQATADLILAAMDTIVDKTDTNILEERVTIMKEALAKLEAARPIVRDLAGKAGSPESADKFEENLVLLTPKAITDLPRAVREGAAEQVFAALDDEIDGGGEQIAVALNALKQNRSDALAIAAKAASASVSSAFENSI